MEKAPLIDRPREALRIPLWARRRRGHPVTRYATLACLAILVYLITFKATPVRNGLSLQKLQEQLATCKRLRNVPAAPSGWGEVKKRWIAGTKPVLKRNAPIGTGEPRLGTSPEDARKGIG